MHMSRTFALSSASFQHVLCTAGLLPTSFPTTGATETVEVDPPRAGPGSSPSASHTGAATFRSPQEQAKEVVSQVRLTAGSSCMRAVPLMGCLPSRIWVPAHCLVDSCLGELAKMRTHTTYFISLFRLPAYCGFSYSMW